jgi:hypothetical protein
MTYQGEDRRMSDNGDWKFEVQRVCGKIEGLETKINNMETNSKDIKDSVNEIKKVLLGNGKIGICGKVQILWGGSLFVIASIVGLLIRSFLLK